jgi:hypothetical protein
MTTVVTVAGESTTVVVADGLGTLTVTTTATEVVTAQVAGPQGPPGPLGPFLGHIWIPGIPDAGEEVFSCVTGEALVVGANLSSWACTATSAATGTTVATVYRNATAVGTLTWSPGGTIPAFATTGGVAQAYTSTDTLSVTFPAPADITLAGIRIRVYATRP